MQYKTVIKFEIDEMLSKTELKEYIKEAIEAWGGQRQPEDWLCYGIEKVKIGKIKDAK